MEGQKCNNFKREQVSTAHVSRETTREQAEIEEAMEKEGRKRKVMDNSFSKWEKPQEGQLKVNTNGAWNYTTKEAGIGYIIRNSEGITLLAAAAYHESPSILYSELLAIKSAMNYIHSSMSTYAHTIHIESDSLEAIQAIIGKNAHTPVETHRLLQEIQLMKSMRIYCFSHIRREGNEPANWLAGHAKLFRLQNVWKDNGLTDLARLLFGDVQD